MRGEKKERKGSYVTRSLFLLPNVNIRVILPKVVGDIRDGEGAMDFRCHQVQVLRRD